MVITLSEFAREALRPLKRGLEARSPRPVNSRFADLVRAVDARGMDGVGTPIADFVGTIGRRLDFQI